MQIQITQAMLDNVIASNEVKRDAFFWAEALCERHLDHEGDSQAELWASVNNALGIDTKSDNTVGVMPMLAAIEIKSSDSSEVGAPLAKALVSLRIDTTGQVIDLGWLDNPESTEAEAVQPEGLDDPNVVRIKAANLRVAAMSDASGKFVAMIHNDSCEPLESIPTTGTAHAARDWATVNAIIDDMRQCATMLWGPNRTTGKPNPRAKNMN